MAVNTLKYSSLQVPDQDKFNGSNFNQFCQSFRLILYMNGLKYLIDDKLTPPQGVDMTGDNFVLYSILSMNINDNARTIISKHSESDDGKSAWKTFKEYYGETDTGTTLTFMSEWNTLSWPGGDKASFDEFVGKYTKVTTALSDRAIKLQDSLLAGMIVSTVPYSYVKQTTINMSSREGMKTNEIVSAIPAAITLEEREPQTAYLSSNGRHISNRPNGTGTQPSTKEPKQQSGNHNKKDKDNSKPFVNPCLFCKNKLKQPPHLCRHIEEKCFKKPAMPTLAEEWEKERRGDVRALISEEKRPSSMLAEVVYPAYMALPFSNITTRAILPDSKPAWILDSGCTTSMVPSADMLDNYETVMNHFVQLADGTKVSITGKGSFSFIGDNDRTYIIKKVFHVPQLTAKLLSLRKFCQNGLTSTIADNLCTVRDTDNSIIFQAAYEQGLIRCVLNPVEGESIPHSSEKTLLTDAVLLHRRHGHVDVSKMGIDGACAVGKDCEACVLGKFRRVPFSGSSH